MCFGAKFAVNLSLNRGIRKETVTERLESIDFLLINFLQLVAYSFVPPTNVNTVFQGEFGYLKKLLAGTNDNPISDEAILQNAKIARFCQSPKSSDVSVHGFVQLLVSLVEFVSLVNLICLSNAVVSAAVGERRRCPSSVLRSQTLTRRRRPEHRTRYR